MRFRQEVLNLFNSARPFLNQNAQKIIGTTQHFAELLQSPTGVKAINSFNDLNFKTSTRAAGSGPETANFNPYSLFLVFYLLILASDPKSLEAGNPSLGLEIPSILPMPARKESTAKEEDRSENPT
ncbi:MAG: hypothetical protein WDA53_07665 [Bacillota bacterium]